MLSRQPVPRIRVDLLDSSSYNLSPSSTLDIEEILSQTKPLPTLLTENFTFDDSDDALYLEDDHPQEVPPFPIGHQPPLFILNSHRARLPFPIRSEAFELGDFCWDEEDVYPLLTAPTMPRMKLMIQEQLYVQKWVDTLTVDCPPKHIPWTCERSAMEREWIAEGSIFPTAVVKSSSEQRRVTEEHPLADDVNRSSAFADQVPCVRRLCIFSAASAPTYGSTESNTSMPHVPVGTKGVESSILRSESKTLQNSSRRIVRTSQEPSLPTLLPPGSPIRTTTPDVLLAARRGKSLSGLKLKGSVIEQLEYPDIPTAFRGSPGIWPSRFEASPTLSFTDHQSMLLNLKSKCAVLGNGVPTYILKPSHPQTETNCASLNVDEWTFAQGLDTLDNNFLGPVDSHISREGRLVDSIIFLPDGFSTPAKGPSSTARLEFAPRLHSTPAIQFPIRRTNDPPGDPLPPRPALISPSTSPYVRGILKKVKSVRFEDIITKESQDHALPVIPPPQAQPESRPPLPSTVSPGRPCISVPNIPKPSSGGATIREMPTLGRNIQGKKPTPRTRLPPKRTKANRKLEAIHPNTGKMPETSKVTSAAISVERPRRAAHVDGNTNSAAVTQTRAQEKGLFVTETDVRRGIEGTTKTRLSTPLRNIFRFR